MATGTAFDLLAAAQVVPPIAPIEHVFVLMLENRSFDHLFGLSAIHNVAPPPAACGFSAGASDRLMADPHHEYADVAAQINGGAMDGFGATGGDTMLGFTPQQVPVLSAIAQNGLLMDNWYSSMPGPTWPNRFFVHAASSAGLDNSPSGVGAVEAVTSPVESYRFENGHIFDRLTREGRGWRIYHDDAFPQVLALRGMVDKRFDPAFFRPFSEFASDTAGQYDVAYTFIEPSYDPICNYANGTSQHPLGSVAAGESLAKATYEAIFSSATGARSVLVIVWDEHGGFFDHATPPPATPPGDAALNHDRAADPKNCMFDSFGVRVPALIVSPWLPAGLGSQVYQGSTFDHASVVSSLRMTFGLGEPLTARDANAPSWYIELLHEPRAVATRLPAAPSPSAPVVAPQAVPAGPGLLGIFQNAVKFDWALAARSGQQPLVASTFRDRLAAVDTTTGQAGGGTLSSAQRDVVVSYLAALSEREASMDHDGGA